MCNQSNASSDVDVELLRERFAELRKRQAAAGRTLAVLAVVLIGFFGAFTFLTVSRVRDNFSQTAVHKAVTSHLPAVTPIVGSQLEKAAMGALPVYHQLAVARFEKIRPTITAKAYARLDAVPDRTGRMMSDRLNGSFSKAVKRAEPEFRAKFPSLTDDAKRQILADYFHDMIDARNKEIAGHVDAIYTNQLIAVHSALEKFDLPDSTMAIDPERLQRDFLHSLLVVADYELTSADPAAKTVAKPAASDQASVAE